MQITKEITELIHSIAGLADSIKRKVFYYLLVGAISASLIAWQWINVDQHIAWTVLKAITLVLPLLIWSLFHGVAKQLSELPEALERLENTGQEGIALIKSVSSSSKTQPKGGFSKIFQLVRMLRDPEIFEFVMDSVKGIAIIMNPLLLFALLGSSVCIFIFAVIALLIIIF